MSELVIIAKLGIEGTEPDGLWHELADQYAGTHLIPAEIHTELFDSVEQQDGDKRAIVHKMMLLRAHASLVHGHSVIYDAPVLNPDTRAHLAKLATKWGAKLVLVHPTADETTIRSRISAGYLMDDLYVPSAETTLKEQLGVVHNMMGSRRVANIDNLDGSGNFIVPHLCVDGVGLSVADIAYAVQMYARDLSAPSNPTI